MSIMENESSSSSNFYFAIPGAIVVLSYHKQYWIGKYLRANRRKRVLDALYFSIYTVSYPHNCFLLLVEGPVAGLPVLTSTDAGKTHCGGV
jgi:hypothetical protein